MAPMDNSGKRMSAAALLAESFLGRAPGGSGEEIRGASWQEHGRMPPSKFRSVVALPTIAGDDFGVAPTASEMEENLGRSPDKYEKEQASGINPFFFSRGAIEATVGRDGEESVRYLATNKFIAPEKRIPTLLRLPLDVRGSYVAIWTLLDMAQGMDRDLMKRYLEEDPVIAAIIDLNITDALLSKIGSFGFIQDAMVYCGYSNLDIVSEGTDVIEFFGGVLPGTEPAPEAPAAPVPVAAPTAAVPVAAAPLQQTPVVEDDELKPPEQLKPIKIRIPAACMTVSGKCAYVVYTDDDGSGNSFLLVAQIPGSQYQEFDPGANVIITVDDKTYNCTSVAKPFNVEEAGVVMQLYSVKK